MSDQSHDDQPVYVDGLTGARLTRRDAERVLYLRAVDDDAKRTIAEQEPPC